MVELRVSSSSSKVNISLIVMNEVHGPFFTNTKKEKKSFHVTLGSTYQILSLAYVVSPTDEYKFIIFLPFI